MSIVRSVSDITNILSSIIQKPILQNVNVHGEVSVDIDDPPGVFWLRQGGNKIRCFVPDGNIFQFDGLLAAGNMIVVNGKITLFYRFSQYQIKVSNIQGAGAPGAKVNVTEITDQISELVSDTPELQNIRIQGEVLEVFSASNWDLCDVGGPPELRIKCVNSGSMNPDIQVGNNVCIQGEISIYPPRSLYQVSVTEVGPTTESSTPECQCTGCESCDSQRGNQSCPSLQDPEYELCANCYHESPDREDRVGQAVYAYLDALAGNGFSPQKERQIQIGSDNRRADVVLVKNGTETFAAIAECKGAGYVGHGIEQLKSYLSATDTRFGIFANRADPKDWKFYKNRRANCIPEIDLPEFKEGVVEGSDTRERLRNEIGHLNGEITGLENQKSELIAAVEEITQTEHNLTERASNLTQQIEVLKNYKSELHEEIHRKLDNLLEEKMQRLEKPLSDMKIELQKRGIVNWFKNLFSKEK